MAPSTTLADLACWYAMQTKPKQEDRAEANLRAWGIETLLPRIRQPQRDRAGAPRIELLFPGYLFARFEAAAMTQKVRYTRGVSKILGNADGAYAIDDQIITIIRGRIGDDGYVRIERTLQRGDRVRITGGPLRDFMGVFEGSMQSSQRVTLLLSAVSGQIRVDIDEALIEKVEAAQRNGASGHAETSCRRGVPPQHHDADALGAGANSQR